MSNYLSKFKVNFKLISKGFINLIKYYINQEINKIRDLLIIKYYNKEI